MPKPLDDLLGEPECRHRNVGFGYHVFRDGSCHVVNWCHDCDTRRGPEYVAKTEVERRGASLHLLPTVIDDRSDSELCAVEGCPSFNTQLHHWAPQSLSDHFGAEWVRWPTAFLCDRHHPLWHRVVTPELVQPMQIGQIMETARKGTPFRELLDAARAYLKGAP